MKSHVRDQQREDEADQNVAFYNEGAGAFLNEDLGEFPEPKVGFGSYDPSSKSYSSRRAGRRIAKTWPSSYAVSCSTKTPRSSTEPRNAPSDSMTIPRSARRTPTALRML
jgi:hypothetical protein